MPIRPSSKLNTLEDMSFNTQENQAKSRALKLSRENILRDEPSVREEKAIANLGRLADLALKLDADTKGLNNSIVRVGGQNIIENMSSALKIIVGVASGMSQAGSVIDDLIFQVSKGEVQLDPRDMGKINRAIESVLQNLGSFAAAFGALPNNPPIQGYASVLAELENTAVPLGDQLGDKIKELMVSVKSIGGYVERASDVPRKFQ